MKEYIASEVTQTLGSFNAKASIDVTEGLYAK
jgi:hypothetical protein